MKKEKENGTEEKMKKEKEKKGIQLPEKTTIYPLSGNKPEKKTTGYRVNAMHQRLLHNLEADTQ